MQRLRAVLIVMACVTLQAACHSVEPIEPGVNKVRLTQSPADLVSCTLIGAVHVPRNPNTNTVVMSEAQRQFRNQVLSLGGNAGLVTSGFISIPNDGVAYQCPVGAATAQAGTTVPAAAAVPAVAAPPAAPAPISDTPRGAACDRACLEGFVDQYLDAAIAHDPRKVPLAPGVRFTEDGQQLEIGDGLWRTLKAKGKYRLFVSDVPAGQVGFFGSIAEDNRDPSKSTPGIIALRLKVRDRKITEIEQLVARNEMAGAHLDTLTVNPVYLQPVPAAERMSRADLLATANKYFSGMQQNDGKGDYPFADDCNRLENGNQSTNVPTPAGQTRPDPKTASMYSGQWSCMEQFRSGLLHFVYRIRDRRFVALDEERGIALAYCFFDHPGGATRTFTTPDGRSITAGPVQPWTWEVAELFKVQGGKIHKIEAVLQRSPYGMLSGWSNLAEGMSDKARDVTGVK